MDVYCMLVIMHAGYVYCMLLDCCTIYNYRYSGSVILDLDSIGIHHIYFEL